MYSTAVVAFGEEALAGGDAAFLEHPARSPPFGFSPRERVCKEGLQLGSAAITPELLSGMTRGEAGAD